MAKLSQADVLSKLKNLKEWRLEGDEIRKDFRFASFIDAMKFVNKVADLAEEADHHPQILVNYRKVALMLSTHDEGGITDKDFSLAKQIDAAIESMAQ